jgi:hypothetical protein
MPVLSQRIGRGGETGGLGIFYKRAILRAATAIAPFASRWRRWPMASPAKRRSVQSRRATGLRRPLRDTPFGLEMAVDALGFSRCHYDFRKVFNERAR